MEIKQVFKCKDGTYVMGGYHVCPKDIDPMGKYDIEEIELFIKDHPECLIPEPLPQEPTQEEKDAQEINILQAYLDSTDKFSIRENETGKKMPAEMRVERQEARDKISELRGQ